MARFALICLAGAVGTATRYLIGLGAARTFGLAFPWGTLTVNLAGCFLMAFVMTAASLSASIPETARLVLTTGFMGGLTTYSAFNFETSRFLSERSTGAAAAYFLATTLGCLLLGVLGTFLARRLAGG